MRLQPLNSVLFGARGASRQPRLGSLRASLKEATSRSSTLQRKRCECAALLVIRRAPVSRTRCGGCRSSCGSLRPSSKAFARSKTSRPVLRWYSARSFVASGSSSSNVRRLAVLSHQQDRTMNARFVWPRTAKCSRALISTFSRILKGGTLLDSNPSRNVTRPCVYFHAGLLSQGLRVSWIASITGPAGSPSTWTKSMPSE